jgi:hypothetical protein
MKPEGAKSNPAGEAGKWKIAAIALACIVFGGLSVFVFILNADENRPRESECKRNMKKIALKIEECANKDSSARLPSRENGAIRKALPNDAEKFPALFLCPFSGTEPGGCDYEGIDLDGKKETFYGNMLLWEYKSWHGGGRYALACDNSGILRVEFLPEEEFQKKYSLLLKLKRDSSLGTRK